MSTSPSKKRPYPVLLSAKPYEPKPFAKDEGHSQRELDAFKLNQKLPGASQSPGSFTIERLNYVTT
jgi:hypothetical protein